MKLNTNALMLLPLAFACGTTALAEVANGTKDNAANTYTIKVESGDVALNDADVTALGKDVTLIKTGEGRLIISKDLQALGYDGEIRINEGYLRTTVNGALGGMTKGTFIGQDGKDSTLEIEDNSKGYDQIHPLEPITVQGVGVGGHGAIYAVNKGKSIETNGMCGRSTVTMTGDTTVGYSGPESFDGTFGMRNSPELNMNGHTLTIQGGSNDGFFFTSVKNAGNIVVQASVSQFTFENSSNLGGDGDNVFTVASGVKLILANQVAYSGATALLPWTLRTEGTLTVESHNERSTNNGWAGPIELGGTLTYNGSTAEGQLAMRFDGKVSGSGGIIIATGACQMSGQNNKERTNSYTGVTRVKSGATLIVESMALVPADRGQFVVEDGAHVRYSNSADVTATAERAIAAAMSVCTNSSYVAKTTDFIIDTDVSLPAYAAPIAAPMTFVGCFSPLVNFCLASQLNGASLFQRNGTKTIVTTGGESGGISTYGGTIDIAVGAYVDVKSNGVYSDGAYPDVGRVSVHGTLVQAESGTQAIDAGRGETSIGATSRGIFEMFAGSSVTGRVERNRGGVLNARAQGSYYFHGGTMYNYHALQESFIADGRCAYYSIERGAHIIERGSSRVARGGTALFHVRGGSYDLLYDTKINNYPNNFNIGISGGTGDILVDNGGQILFENTIFSLGRQIEAYESPDSCGRKLTMGIDGEGSKVRFNQMWPDSIPMLACCNKAVASVGVLNGGTIVATTFKKPAEGPKGDSQTGTAPLVDAHAIVAFDRGTYEAANNLGIYTLFTGFTQDDHVLSYEGGMTIKTDADSFSIGAAVEAPTGSGIESIELPDEVKSLGAWAYTAAPRVEISDPTGLGAAAVAVFDTINGVLTGIKVTCRGIGYTDPSVKLTYGGYTSDFTFKTGIVMTENVSGGFTKDGSKTLTVDVAGTYTGPTTVKAGTLKLGIDDAIAASAGVIMAGGTLDVNETDFDRPILGGCGEVVNVGHAITSSTALSFVATDLIAKRMLVVNEGVEFADDTVVAVDNIDTLVNSGRHTFTLVRAEAGFSGPLPTLDVNKFPGSWRLYLGADGKSLKLNDGTGFALIIR